MSLLTKHTFISETNYGVVEKMKQIKDVSHGAYERLNSKEIIPRLKHKFSAHSSKCTVIKNNIFRVLQSHNLSIRCKFIIKLQCIKTYIM